MTDPYLAAMTPVNGQGQQQVPPAVFGSAVPAPAEPMPMPDPIQLGNAVRDLRRFREQGLESLGVARSVIFQPGGPGAEVFEVSHPLLLSDEQNEEIAKPHSFPEVAAILLNTVDDPDIYARFRAAGGQSGDVMIAWRHLSAGLDVPKSDGR